MLMSLTPEEDAYQTARRREEDKRLVVTRRRRRRASSSGSRDRQEGKMVGQRRIVGPNQRLLLLLPILTGLLQEPSSIQCQEVAHSPVAAAASAMVSARQEVHRADLQLSEAISAGPTRFARALMVPSALSLAPANFNSDAPSRTVGGSKSEPPSRPTQDWSKQRPRFGQDMVHNVSVELGKTAYLTCKVFELGDKTVSWLRPRENQILTVGKFTYIADSRFTAGNDQNGPDWTLEIKDVGLNDSTSYECQVSTDPKMSTIINLHVKAGKASIKQGEHYYANLNSNIEFTCHINHLPASGSLSVLANNVQQTYWYFNGNLLNYARAHLAHDKNFTIDWDSISQSSKFRLFNVQNTDSGNYTCKPTSAEPATIRLHVKRISNKNGYKSYHNNPSNRHQQQEAQRNSLGLFDAVDSGSLSSRAANRNLSLGHILSSVSILFLLTRSLNYASLISTG